MKLLIIIIITNQIATSIIIIDYNIVDYNSSYDLSLCVYSMSRFTDTNKHHSRMTLDSKKSLLK